MLDVAVRPYSFMDAASMVFYQIRALKTKTWRGAAIALCLMALYSANAAADDTANPGTGSVTGLRIPRFVSLKADEVNARVGPGSDYQIAWIFRRAGLPVEVLGEFENWRQIRDSGGSTGWVSATLVSARRTALVAPWLKERKLFQLTSSRGGSSVVAEIEPGAIVDISACDGESCRVYAGQQEGWVMQSVLWGVYPGETVK